MTTHRRIGPCLSALALTLLATTAAAQPRAGHSDYLSGLTRQAMERPFRKDYVPLLDVVPGQGRERTAAALLATLEQDAGIDGLNLASEPMRPQAEDDKVLTLASDRAYLDVIADGSAFRFRADIDNAARPRAEPGRQLPARELERLGRRFLAGPLADFVPLGRRERITFLGVRYLYEGEGAVGAAAADREATRVVAGIAVFGREIDRVPVVGSGSKIAVWFDNARRPVGFDVDWPVYRIGRDRQQLLPTADLRRRVAATTVAPEGEAGIAVDRFECGHVDLGATRRDGQLQAGCSIAYRGTGRDETWARLDFVPAAVEVRRERRWPLATALAAGAEVKVGSRDYDRFLQEAPPPANPPAERPDGGGG
jgi:hypothetical protein